LTGTSVMVSIGGSVSRMLADASAGGGVSSRHGVQFDEHAELQHVSAVGQTASLRALQTGVEA